MPLFYSAEGEPAKIKPMSPEIQEKRLFKYSIDFIKRHDFLTTDEIPTDLLKYWLVPGFGITQWATPTENQILIFMYAANSRNLFKDAKFVDTFLFYKLFFDFQVIIAVTYISRLNNQPMKPVYIFDFWHYGGYDLNDVKNLMKKYNEIVTEDLTKD